MKLAHLLIIASYYLKLLKASSPCTTPNSEQAKCVSLFSCDILQKALSNGDAASKKFVEASKCRGDFMVCCGTLGNFTNLTAKKVEPPKKHHALLNAAETTEGRREYVIKHVLPTLDYCGYQHSDDYFIENKENSTSIDEYPWIVHINYPGEYLYLHPTAGTEFKCVGVLISNSIVLTSQSCGTYMRVKVRIGQYHKRNTTSCTESSAYGEECTDPVVEVEGTLRDIPNTDLVLVRLPINVTYSDYIRPICLPLEESQRAKAGDTVYTSGWGEKDIKGSTITIKKRIVHQLQANKEGDNSETVNFIKKNSSHYDVCEGDQGGPLMSFSKKHQWFLTGVVKTLPCNSTEPAVATRITSKLLNDIMDPIFYIIINNIVG